MKEADYWKRDSQLTGGHVTSAGKKEKNHPVCGDRSHQGSVTDAWTSAQIHISDQ